MMKFYKVSVGKKIDKNIQQKILKLLNLNLFLNLVKLDVNNHPFQIP